MKMHVMNVYEDRGRVNTRLVIGCKDQYNMIYTVADFLCFDVEPLGLIEVPKRDADEKHRAKELIEQLGKACADIIKAAG